LTEKPEGYQKANKCPSTVASFMADMWTTK